MERNVFYDVDGSVITISCFDEFDRIHNEKGPACVHWDYSGLEYWRGYVLNNTIISKEYWKRERK